MMNPLKLCVVTLGSACFLAIAPWLVKQVLHPMEIVAAENPSQPARVKVETEPPRQMDLQLAPRTVVATPQTQAHIQEQQLSESSLPAPPAAQPIVVANLPAPARAITVHPPAVVEPTATPKIEIPFRADVQQAQQNLAKLGFEVGTADGKLGSKTQSTLAEFQKRNKLVVTSDADKPTLELLTKLVAELPPPAPKAPEPAKAVAEAPKKKVDPGPVPGLNNVGDVKKIQSALAAVDAYPHPIDGKWGKLTIDAMRQFQTDQKLKVTGKPNSETWTKLHEVAAKRPDTSTSEKEVDVASAKTSAEKAPEKSEKPAAPAVKVTTEGPAAAAEVASTSAGLKPMIKGLKASSESVSAVPASGIAAQVRAAKSTAVAPVVRSPKVIAEKKAEIAPPSVVPPSPQKEVKAVGVAASTKADEAVSVVPPNAEKLEISKPAEKPAIEVAPAAEKPIVSDAGATGASKADPESGEVVIRMNVDVPEKGEITAPAKVSEEIKAPAAEPVKVVASVPEVKPAAKSEVAVPDTRITVPALAAVNPEREAQLEREMTKAQVEAIRPRETEIILRRDNPKVADSLQTLATKAPQSESTAADQLSEEKLKKAATEKVAEVDELYKLVKQRFPEQVKKSTFAEKMALIDAGYKAMKEDYKKGNYSPIVKRCDGFKLAIEMLADDVAKVYLEGKLSEKSVRSKLNKDVLSEVEQLQQKKKYLEAVDLLDSSLNAKETKPKGRS